MYYIFSYLKVRKEGIKLNLKNITQLNALGIPVD